jgi:hypothetical protein
MRLDECQIANALIEFGLVMRSRRLDPPFESRMFEGYSKIANIVVPPVRIDVLHLQFLSLRDTYLTSVRSFI